jgi:hypothetical protein
MQDPPNFQTVSANRVKHQIAVDWKIPQTAPKLVPRSPCLRVVCQHEDRLVDSIVHVVGRSHAIFCNGKPDLVEV